MKIRSVLLVAFILLFQSGCQKKDIVVISEQEKDMIVTQDGVQLEPSALEQGHVRLQLSEEMTALAESDPEAFRELFTSLGATSVERTFPYAGKFEKRTRKEGLHRWYDVYFDEKIPLTKAGEELSLIDELGYVEYRPKMVRVESQDVSWRSGGLTNSDISLSSKGKTDIFDDPYLSRQWHYYNSGAFQGAKAGCDINVLPVWKDITVGSPEVIVAVVDGGIDFNHEDLAANMWHDPDYPDSLVYGFNFVHQDLPIEPEDHGTHVAGTVAAVNNNGIGVCGIAGGNMAAGQPGVRLMSCQIFIEESRYRTGDGAVAIKWGADHGAVISQNSWGYDGAGVVPKSDKEAIDYFNKYAGVDEEGNQTGPMKGGVVFFAAGNEHRHYCIPASYVGCVAVSAVDARFKATGYTNYGDWVDIAAPGGDSDHGPIVMSTVKDNKYAYYEGTSMACPHVSGVAALIVSQLGGVGFTRDMLLDRILGNTTDLSQYGVTNIGNLVNAYAAIAGSSKVAPDSVTDYKLSVSSNKIHFRLRIPEDEDDGSPYGIMVWYSDEAFESMESATAKAFEVDSLKAGDYLEGDIDDLGFEKEYYVAFDAYDLSGNHSSLSPLELIVTGANTPPVIESDEPLDNISLRYYDTKEINLSYYDPDGHDVTVAFEDNSGGAATFSDMPEQGKSRVRINCLAVQPGSYEFSFTVTDRYGAATTIKVPYVIKPNTPPVKLQDIDNIVIDTKGGKKVLDLSKVFYDDDGEKLSITFTMTDKSVISVSPAALNMYAITPMMQGITNVTATATDGKGQKVSSTFKVLARDASVPFDIYPNPVTDGKLYIRCGEASSVKVLVSGPSGATVFNGSVDVAPFDPSVIDLSEFATGAYRVKVSNDKESVSTTIINLRND